MIIKCPGYGIEYSYGRNICHICKNHSIFFRALFDGRREGCWWNCSENNHLGSSKVNSFEDKEDLDLTDV